MWQVISIRSTYHWPTIIHYPAITNQFRWKTNHSLSPVSPTLEHGLRRKSVTLADTIIPLFCNVARIWANIHGTLLALRNSIFNVDKSEVSRTKPVTMQKVGMQLSQLSGDTKKIVQWNVQSICERAGRCPRLIDSISRPAPAGVLSKFYEIICFTGWWVCN